MGTRASRGPPSARLLEVDRELAEGLEAAGEHRPLRVDIPVVDVPPGPWSPAGLVDPDGHPFALLLSAGLVVRELLLGDSTASELLSAGDLVDHRAARDTLVPAATRWTVAERARIAVLDQRVLPLMATHPELATRLLARSARQATRLAVQRAISQLPRVEDRLLALFGHLAERWGRVGGAGIIVPLRLTHETLGRLVGARRPTVSLALKHLAATGAVARRPDGSWLLRPGALDVLSPPATAGRRRSRLEARVVDLGAARQ
jgi:CRP/FNR family transcriptional regulator, cyclic AMP receptor protein